MNSQIKKKSIKIQGKKEDDLNDPIDQSYSLISSLTCLFRIKIEAHIWDRDSHGLYDYESNNIVKQVVKCTGCSKIIAIIFVDMIARKDYQIKCLLPQVDNEQDYQPLISLVYKQGQYWFYHSKSLSDDCFKNHADRVWKIVKWESYDNKKVNQYRVVEGDIIKFGRVRFKVKKLVIDRNELDDMVVDDQVDQTKVPKKHPSNNFETQHTQNNLRAQLTTVENETYNHQQLGDYRLNSEPETRMTQSFGNKETLGFDHNRLEFEEVFLKAKEQEIRLKSSLLNRQMSSRSTDQVFVYLIHIVQQICKICLSEEETYNPLISPCSCTGSMKFIHVNCLKEWLEGKKHMKETSVVNSYIWKNLECEICKTPFNEQVNLKNGSEVNILNYQIHDDAANYMIIESGRGQNSEVRITDISVSRFHTLIRLNSLGEVIVEDNQSKFGTLVQLNEPLPIKSNHPTYLQIGRSVVVLQAVNRFSCIQRCFGGFSSKQSKETYCLHYDEAAKYFPMEFALMFDKFVPKKSPHLIQSSVPSFLSNGQIGMNEELSLENQRRFQEQMPPLPNFRIQENIRTNTLNEVRAPTVAIDFVTLNDPENNQNQVISLLNRGGNAQRLGQNNLEENYEHNPPQHTNSISFSNRERQQEASSQLEERKELRHMQSDNLAVVENQSRHPLSQLNSERNRGQDYITNSVRSLNEVNNLIDQNHKRVWSQNRQSLPSNEPIYSPRDLIGIDNPESARVVQRTYVQEVIEEEMKEEYKEPGIFIMKNEGDEGAEMIFSQGDSLYNISNIKSQEENQRTKFSQYQRQFQKQQIFNHNSEITNHKSTMDQQQTTNMNMSNNESPDKVKVQEEDEIQIKDQKSQQPSI